MVDGGSPFFGFETVRRAMRAGGGPGPTLSMAVAGVALIALGIRVEAVGLDVLGAALVIAGGWPSVTARRSGNDAARLETHARRETQLVTLAHDIAGMSAAEAMAARPGLAGLVEADAAAAATARTECLRRARLSDAPDRWLDAANLLERSGDSAAGAAPVTH